MPVLRLLPGVSMHAVPQQTHASPLLSCSLQPPCSLMLLAPSGTMILQVSLQILCIPHDRLVADAARFNGVRVGANRADAHARCVPWPCHVAVPCGYAML